MYNTFINAIYIVYLLKNKLYASICVFLLGGKNARGIRVSSYDPDDPNSQQPTEQPSKTLGNQRKFMPGSQRVATISQNYNEKTMLLSSDDECQWITASNYISIVWTADLVASDLFTWFVILWNHKCCRMQLSIRAIINRLTALQQSSKMQPQTNN